MSLKNSEEATMEVVCSQVEDKSTLDGKENMRADTPPVDDSIMQLSPKCKQSDSDDNALRDAGLDKNGNDATFDSDSETNTDGKKSKKKRRRRHKGGKNHRRWKPYDKMTWTEKKDLEEKETIRATQKRADAFASGHPVAPYNTTQFLMEDHFQDDAVSPDLHRHNSKDSNASNCTDSSSELDDAAEEADGNFQTKNFESTFNEHHRERLMEMTKEQLIKDYVEMETKLEGLQSDHGQKASRGSEKVTEESVDMKNYSRVQVENDRLKALNVKLHNELNSLKSMTT